MVAILVLQCVAKPSQNQCPKIAGTFVFLESAFGQGSFLLHLSKATMCLGCHWKVVHASDCPSTETCSEAVGRVPHLATPCGFDFPQCADCFPGLNIPVTQSGMSLLSFDLMSSYRDSSSFKGLESHTLPTGMIGQH